MRAALHAEWTKLQTVPSTGWLVLAVVGLTVATGTLASLSVDTVRDEDTVRLSLAETMVGQLAVVVLAALAASTTPT